MLGIFTDILVNVCNNWTEDYNKTLGEFKALKHLENPSDEEKARLIVLEQRIQDLKTEFQAMGKGLGGL